MSKLNWDRQREQNYISRHGYESAYADFPRKEQPSLSTHNAVNKNDKKIKKKPKLKAYLSELKRFLSDKARRKFEEKPLQNKLNAIKAIEGTIDRVKTLTDNQYHLKVIQEAEKLIKVHKKNIYQNDESISVLADRLLLLIEIVNSDSWAEKEPVYKKNIYQKIFQMIKENEVSLQEHSPGLIKDAKAKLSFDVLHHILKAIK